MNTTEKTTVTREICFSEEDLELIVYVLKRVWSFATIDRLIDNYDRSFAKVLTMLYTIRDNVFYHKRICAENSRDMLQELSDALCTFEVHYPDDAQFQAVDDMWRNVIILLKSVPA